MTILRFGPPFNGTSPRVSARNLQKGQSQVAINTKFISGDLEGIGTDIDTTWPFQKTGLVKSIYKFAADTPTSKFLMWLADVDAVRGQVSGNTTDKTYYTGDGVPKKLDATRVAADGIETPLNMDVPPPQTALIGSAAENIDDGLNELTNYVWTYVSSWGEEGPPSPASDQVKFDTAMTFAGQWITLATTAIGDTVKAGEFKATVSIAGTTGATEPVWPVPVTWVASTVVALNDIAIIDNIAATASTGGTSGLIEPKWTVTTGWQPEYAYVVGDQVLVGNFYIKVASVAGGTLSGVDEPIWSTGAIVDSSITWTVSAPGANPSPITDGTVTWAVGAALADVVDDTTTWTLSAYPIYDVSIILSNLGSAPTGAYDIQNKRIYRDVSGQSGTQYQFVVELPVGVTTFTDTFSSSAIASSGAMVSLTYDPPPATMQGLKSMPNGVMVAFDGSDLLFSEPYQPFAWPIDYMQSTDYPIVGVGVFGNSVLVCTTNHPYLYTGIHPSGMTGGKLRERQSCVSKRSIVDMGGAAIYASPDGLVMASGGDAILATDKHINREKWQSLNPSSIHAYYSEGRYVAFYDATSIGGVKGGFVVSMRDPEFGFIWLNSYYSTGFTDEVNDALYLVTEAGPANVPPAKIVEWDAGISSVYEWRSGINVLPKPVNFSCAKLIADTYPLTVNFYADGVMKHTQTVQNREIFRLPAGFLSDEWEVSFSGMAKVHSLEMATTVEELKVV